LSKKKLKCYHSAVQSGGVVSFRLISLLAYITHNFLQQFFTRPEVFWKQ